MRRPVTPAHHGRLREGGEGNRPLEFVLLSRLTTSLSGAEGRRKDGAKEQEKEDVEEEKERWKTVGGVRQRKGGTERRGRKRKRRKDGREWKEGDEEMEGWRA